MAAERVLEAQQATQVAMVQAYGQLTASMTDMSAAFRERGNIRRGQNMDFHLAPSHMIPDLDVKCHLNRSTHL